jgi:hypothetical protein
LTHGDNGQLQGKPVISRVRLLIHCAEFVILLDLNHQSEPASAGAI